MRIPVLAPSVLWAPIMVLGIGVAAVSLSRVLRPPDKATSHLRECFSSCAWKMGSAIGVNGSSDNKGPHTLRTRV